MSRVTKLWSHQVTFCPKWKSSKPTDLGESSYACWFTCSITQFVLVYNTIIHTRSYMCITLYTWGKILWRHIWSYLQYICIIPSGMMHIQQQHSIQTCKVHIRTIIVLYMYHEIYALYCICKCTPRSAVHFAITESPRAIPRFCWLMVHMRHSLRLRENFGTKRAQNSAPSAVKCEWWGSFLKWQVPLSTLVKQMSWRWHFFSENPWHLKIMACLNLSISGDTRYVHSKLEKLSILQTLPGTSFFRYIIAEHVLNETTSSPRFRLTILCLRPGGQEQHQ